MREIQNECVLITFYFLVKMDMIGLHIISNSIVSDMTKMLVNVV